MLVSWADRNGLALPAFSCTLCKSISESDSTLDKFEIWHSAGARFWRVGDADAAGPVLCVWHGGPWHTITPSGEVLQSSRSCSTMVFVLHQRKNVVRSVWTWQINSTVFNVWNATRVGRRTDTFSPLHGGYDTVNKTPRAATSPLCWRQNDTQIIAALRAPPVSGRRCPSASTRCHNGCKVTDFS